MGSGESKSPLWFLSAVAVVAVYLLGRFVFVHYLSLDPPIPTDFKVYWVMSERLASSESIYNPNDGSPFKYSPIFAYVFYYSLYLLPIKLAVSIWTSCGILLFLVPLAWFGTYLIRQSKNGARVAALVVLSIFLSWRGFLETLSYGQVDLILGGLVLSIFIQVFRPRSILSRALLWSLIFSVKPQFALLLPVAVMTFGWRDGAAAFLVSALLFFAPWIWMGSEQFNQVLLDWYAVLSTQHLTYPVATPLNQSIGAVAARVLERVEWFNIFTLIGIIVFLLSNLYLWRVTKKLRHAGVFTAEKKLALLCIGLSGYLLFSPLSWRWNVFFWIPIVAVVSTFPRPYYKLLPWMILTFVTLGPVANQLQVFHDDFVSFFGIYMFATLLLGVRLLFDIRRVDGQL